MSPKCLHARILGRFPNSFVNLTQQIIGSKDEMETEQEQRKARRKKQLLRLRKARPAR
jgi:hypothetical protein